MSKQQKGSSKQVVASMEKIKNKTTQPQTKQQPQKQTKRNSKRQTPLPPPSPSSSEEEDNLQSSEDEEDQIIDQEFVNDSDSDQTEEDEEQDDDDIDNSSDDIDENGDDDDDDDDSDDDDDEQPTALYSTSGVFDATAFLQEGFKSHLVTTREDDITYDLGNLVAFDAHPLDAAALSKNPEKALLKASRDTVQLLCNRIFSLETKRLPNNEGVMATLPKPLTSLPRAKPVPEDKPATKWEEFALARGIKKTKRERMLWDDTHQEWRPRYGYKRANDEMSEWLVEDNGSIQVGTDPWQIREKEKKERVALNKKQQTKNVLRASKELPGTKDMKEAMTGSAKSAADKKRIRQQLEITNAATASLGHFNSLLPGEQKYKIRTKQSSSRKQDFLPSGDEQQASLKLLDRMSVREKVVDKETAAKRAIGKYQQQSGERRSQKTLERMSKTISSIQRKQQKQSRKPASKRQRSK